MFSFYKIPIIPRRQSVLAAPPTTFQISSIQRPGKESILHRAPHPFPGPMRGLPTSLLSPLHFCFTLCSPTPDDHSHRSFPCLPFPANKSDSLPCSGLAVSTPMPWLQGTLPISCLVPHVYEAEGAYLPTRGALREGLACHSYHCNNQLLW